MKTLSKRLEPVALATRKLLQPRGEGGGALQPAVGTTALDELQRAEAPLRRRAPRTRFLTPARLAFAIVVLLPTALSALYFGLWATDRHVSEAAFVVRSAKKPLGGGLGSFLQMTGIVRSQDDAFSVQEYIQSRDAVAELSQRVPLREMFGRPEADMLSRYPNLFYGASDEDLFSYYKTMVEVIYNANTGITTLRVQAFRNDDALKINQELLNLGEDLVNRMNVRIHGDAVSFAEKEVARAQERLIAAQVAVSSFRVEESMLDPTKSSLVVAEVIGRLQGEISQTTAQLREIQAVSPSSPQIPPLQRRIAALDAQVKQERARVSNASDGFADKIARFERLTLDRDLAAKSLAAALTGLESSRGEARRQQLYLERIVAPRMSDDASEPQGLRHVLVTFGAALLLFFVGWLISAGIREHGVERY